MIYTDNKSGTLQEKERDMYVIARAWAERADGFLSLISQGETQAAYAVAELLSFVEEAQARLRAVRDTTGIRNHFIGVEADVDYDVIAALNSVIDKLDEVALAASQIVVANGAIKTEEWIDGKKYPITLTALDMQPLEVPLTELRALITSR